MVRHQHSRFASIALISALAATSLLATVACDPAPKAPIITDTNSQPTMKPDSISTTQVSLTTMSELSHLERAIKPFIGINPSGVIIAPDAQIPAIADIEKCRVVSSTNTAMWKTKWTCGLTSTESGKKEIEGVETVNYERSTRTLTYNANFETRNFDDRESRSNAHTLSTTRKIKIIFSGSATNDATQALVKMTSTANLKKGDINRKGSNWTSTLNGKLTREGTSWALDSGATIRFRGALYGLDELRYTSWASGDFDFVSETATKLLGVSDSTCTKPIGVWKISAIGGGQNFDTKLETSLAGGQTEGGGFFNWPVGLCDQP